MCFHRETALRAAFAAATAGAHDSALLRRVATFVDRQRLLAQPPPPVLVREAARRARWRVLVDTARRVQHLRGSPPPLDATPLRAVFAIAIELFAFQQNHSFLSIGAPSASACELRIDPADDRHFNVDDDLRLIWTYDLGAGLHDPSHSEFELETANVALFWGRHWPIWAGCMTPDLDDGSTKEFYPFFADEGGAFASGGHFVIAAAPNGAGEPLASAVAVCALVGAGAPAVSRNKNWPVNWTTRFSTHAPPRLASGSCDVPFIYKTDITSRPV